MCVFLIIFGSCVGKILLSLLLCYSKDLFFDKYHFYKMFLILEVSYSIWMKTSRSLKTKILSFSFVIKFLDNRKAYPTPEV